MQQAVARYGIACRRNDSTPADIETARLDMVARRLDYYIEKALLEGLDRDRRLECAAALIGRER